MLHVRFLCVRHCRWRDCTQRSTSATGPMRSLGDVGVFRPVFKKAAGQRHIPHDRDAFFLRHPYHALGKEPFALGKDNRERRPVLFVVQRHGVMGRVGHEHLRFAHVAQRVLGDHFLMELFAFALHLRVAFHLLIFPFDFIFRHHMVLGVLPFLEKVVHGGDDAEDARSHEQQILERQSQTPHVQIVPAGWRTASAGDPA